MGRCPTSDGSGIETCGGWEVSDGIAITKDGGEIRREGV